MKKNVMFLSRLSQCATLLLLLVALLFLHLPKAECAEVGVDNGISRAPLVVSARPGRLLLNSRVEFFGDANQRLSIKSLGDIRWESLGDGRPLNLGFTTDTVWVRVPLFFEPTSKVDRYLVIPYPMLEEVELAIVDRHGRSIYNSNLFHSRKNQTVPSQFIHFAIPAFLQGQYDVVLRVRSTTSLQLPLEIWSEHYLVERQLLEALGWGLYFGVLLALTAYNGFLYFSVRDPVYLFYGLYLTATAGVMLCISGMGALYVWPYDAEYTQYGLTLFTGLTSLFLLMFARAFFDWKGFPDALKGMLTVSALLCAVMIAFALKKPVLGAQLSGWMASMAIGVTILVGIHALRIGVVIARYFLLAFATFALGASLYLLNIFSLLPFSVFTNHAIQVGSALEAVLLSLALAHRIKVDRLAVLHALQQKHETQQQLKQLELDALDAALHDPLTRLPNEALLASRMSELHQTPQTDAYALVMMQFPQMREITASLGRAVSEPLFVRIAGNVNRRLAEDPRAICIEDKRHAYLAVSEFGTLAFLAHSNGQDRQALTQWVESLRATYDSPVDVAHLTLNMPAICGITFYPFQGEKPELLLQHANVSIERAQRTGERLCVYSTDIEASGHRRLALMGSLSRAINEGELDIFVQPQLDCFGMKLVGAEILLRWNSARHGMVPTPEFIDIAEQAGLMPQLGRYVVDRSLNLLKMLHDQNVPVTLSINISVKNLMEDLFIAFVVEKAQALSVDMRHIVIEVTETCASENIDLVIASLRRLAATGCSIALDDFGTGYSSLAYLSRLPIHEVKIDRSFITQMRKSDCDLRIVENTVKLARTLQLQTVAEGVEDAEMLAIVKALGCDRVQGYYTGRPMPADMFAAWALRKAG